MPRIDCPILDLNGWAFISALEFKIAVQFKDKNCKKIRAEIDEAVIEIFTFIYLNILSIHSYSH